MIALKKTLTERKGMPSGSMTSLIKAIDAGVLLIILYMLVTFFCVLLRFFSPATANASPLASLDSKTEMGISGIREGQLMLELGGKGSFAPAPMLKTRADLQINGIIANVQVFQDFINPTDKWLEGIYVFPLPDNAAVYHLRMHVGERIIDGIVKERTEAKKVYKEKKDQGYKASLLEQERPNIFRISVANIGPHEKISIEIIFQQKVHYENGVYSLRFPTVVGPRYIPDPAQTTRYSPTGNGLQADIERMRQIISPVVEPGEISVNPVSIKIHLNSGVALSEIRSLYHGVNITDNDDRSSDITLSGSRVVADRDFVLEWKPKPESEPQAALFAEKRDGENYGLLMVMPPVVDVPKVHSTARTMIFILDASGSMAGASEQQAKYALQTAISRLTPSDHFNIISFNDKPSLLFNEPLPATYKSISKAKQYLKNLESAGGTEMYPALATAMAGKRGKHEGLEQIILVTDGCVGNEKSLLQLINNDLGASRLFTVGIGSAPNEYFMKAAARMGRGSFTFIGDPAEAQVQMLELFRKIEYPMVTDIEVVLPETALGEAIPDPIPDLYLGEPVNVVFKLDKLPETIMVRGLHAGSPWNIELSLSDIRDRNGISIFWAREKIRGLMDSLSTGADKEEVRGEVTKTALSHNLVSRYTSMLAVDTTPTRPLTHDVQKALAATNLPDGWIYSKVFQLPQTATVAELCFVLGLLSSCLAVLATLLVMKGRGTKK